MSEQPDQGDGDEVVAAGSGEAFDATVKTEDNTGGFKPGRDDVEENEQ